MSTIKTVFFHDITFFTDYKNAHRKMGTDFSTLKVNVQAHFKRNEATQSLIQNETEGPRWKLGGPHRVQGGI